MHFNLVISLLLASYYSAVTVGKGVSILGWQDRCNGTKTTSEKALNSTNRLQALREQLQIYNISAFIVTSSDDHQSEYVADHDKRYGFMSGFTGSNAEVIVTFNKAALWTDSRYYIQAAEQMDCNWQLMPTGETGTPSLVTWMGDNLSPGSIISADPKTTSFREWENWRAQLEAKNLTLMVTTDNLVDIVWGDKQPSYPIDKLYVLDDKYTGVSWQDKLNLLREDMRNKSIDTLILTALDEVAWTLNLRGADIPFTPVFRSYLVLSNDSNKNTLYLPSDKITDLVISHLNSNGTSGGQSIRIKNYDDIWSDLERIGRESTKIGLPTAYSYASGVSYLIHTMVPAEKIVDIVSPALIRKDYKNPVESAGMRRAHVKDGVALCVFLARLSADIASGVTNWTELSAVTALDALRWEQPLSRGPSFGTIAAVGINAALPHYEPTPETDRNITDHEVLLIDSGGHYLEGSTDVTRTVHFGNPKEEERIVYTNLLKGCIDLVTTIFPTGKTLADLEILVRRPLYSLGLDYGHGTTHGIGSLLNVHEAFNSTLHLNFYGSQEPGYYKENDFGMRLENIVSVSQAKPTSGALNYLKFETITMVPYERKLIRPELMEKTHIDWLNNYHQTVRTLVGEEMLQQGYEREYEWLINATNLI